MVSPRPTPTPTSAPPGVPFPRHFLVLLPVLVLSLGDAGALASRPLQVAPPLRPGAPLSRPPMGWNSYNRFGCNISEQLIRETADALVSTGLASLGYTFVNVDDCWSDVQRNLQGRLQSDPRTFPSGMKALGEYIHRKGLHFGIYADAGNSTCMFRAGSRGHERTDAATFAEWGVDFLKYDNCYPRFLDLLPFQRYRDMGQALLATGRRIVFSMCEWGLFFPALWARRWAFADLWRTTTDISNSWSSVLWITFLNDAWNAYAAPGGWNDPDMLQVGNGALTPSEERTHFSLWAIMKAPLIIGCDIREMTPNARAVLTNTEVIALNQDPLGVQARRVWSTFTTDVWSGPLAGERHVVALVNRGNTTATVAVHAVADLGIGWATRGFKVRDVWKHVTLVAHNSTLSATLQAHDIALLVLIPP